MKKVGNLEGMQPQSIKPTGGARIGGARTDEIGGGPSFQDILGNAQIGNLNPAKPSVTPAAANGVKFSNHAVERLASRGIKFDQNDRQRLNDAVDRAAAKGSKDSLILMNDSAFIVSVKNKTVVTVMDQSALKENVFTNIDSTIVM